MFVTHVFQGLHHNSTLVHLNLRAVSFEITEDTAEALTKMLQVNKTLTHLDLSYNFNFSDAGAQCVYLGLYHNTALIYLDLSNTGLLFADHQALTTMLQVNKTLTHLNLSNFNNKFLRTPLFSCVCLGLQYNTALVHLNLSSSNLELTSFTAQALARMFRVNKTLTHLDLSCNFYMYSSDSRGQCVYLGLQHNTALLYLNLGCTSCTFTVDQTLTTMLKVNKTLTHLDLSSNYSLSDSGAYYVCQGLQHNTTLVYLNLSRTEITDKGAGYIAQALDFNRSLQTLDISWNKIKDDGFAYIVESLKSNKILKTLYVDYCPITPNLVEAVNQVKLKDT